MRAALLLVLFIVPGTIPLLLIYIAARLLIANHNWEKHNERDSWSN